MKSIWKTSDVALGEGDLRILVEELVAINHKEAKVQSYIVKTDRFMVNVEHKILRGKEKVNTTTMVQVMFLDVIGYFVNKKAEAEGK